MENNTIKQSNRSLRLSVDPEAHEEFTAKDYVQARAMETIFDFLEKDLGFTSDTHTYPDETSFSEATELLGVTVDDEFTNRAGRLLSEASSFCSQVVNSSFVVMTTAERATYSPDYERGDIPVKPFFQQLQYLLARFVTERVDSFDTFQEGTKPSNQDYLDALSEGIYALFSLPAQTERLFTHDLPVYDLVFDVFDRRARTDEDHLEIYLGRDGMYAYYGRLGEVAARGDVSNVGPEFEENFNDTRFKYMVYSTNIKHQPLELRQQYIGQHVSDGDSPHFFDTGFRGSIPEDILRVLGYSDEETDARIHLLNSGHNPNDARRLETLSHNVDIHGIEDSPKPENSSMELKIVAGGLLGYTASKTSLVEQFKYQVMRTMLIRHFWIKEHAAIRRVLGPEE
jgi:hypothetical protein